MTDTISTSQSISYLLNPAMKARALEQANEFISCRDLGMHDEARAAGEVMANLLEGYFLAIGVTLPETVRNQLRTEITIEARANRAGK